MKARWAIFGRDEGESDSPPVSVGSSSPEPDGITLEASFGKEYWDTVEKFLRERIGFLTDREKAEAVSMLVEYGAPEENTARELSMAEKFAAGGERSLLHFKMYECFQENRAIAVGLAIHLARNRALKKQLASLQGDAPVPRNEWDSWDDATVSEYQNRYLFIK